MNSTRQRLSPPQDPASSINAAVAVACLVGHEENNKKLQLDEGLVSKMLEVLDAACQGVMAYGNFWTVWKLCQGLTNLTVNDKNKVQEGTVSIYETAQGSHLDVDS